MPEKQQNLGRQPETSPLPAIDRLVYAYQADLDFKSATNIAASMKESDFKTSAALIVSRSLVRSGQEPLITNSVVTNKYTNNVNSLALLQAEMGEIDKAMETARNYSSTQIEIAGIASKTQDARKYFRQIDQALIGGNMHVITLNIETQRRVGISPSRQLLDITRRRLLSGQGDNLGWRYNCVELFAKAGFTDEAYDIWRTTNDDMWKRKKALSMSQIAISEAENGGNPSGFIEMAQEILDHMESYKTNFYNPSRDQATAYLNIAKSLKNINPTPSLRRAMEYAGRIDDNLQVDTYEDIARAQIGMGLDAKPTIDFALQSFDKHFKTGETDDPYGVGFLNIFGIADTQVAAGYFDDAKNTLRKLNIYPNDFRGDDVRVEIAGIMAQIAESEARRGLSSSEIQSLHPFMVGGMEHWGSPKVQKAIEYFGITKSS